MIVETKNVLTVFEIIQISNTTASIFTSDQSLAGDYTLEIQLNDDYMNLLSKSYLFLTVVSTAKKNVTTKTRISYPDIL